MIRLITDSASTYSKEEALKKGFFVNPLEIIINDKSYKDFEDITSKELLMMIKDGNIPRTSQPNMAYFLDILEEYPNDDFIYISVADGLSGAYQSSVGIRNTINNPERLHILNTRTLWGPQKYIVDCALSLINKGLSINEILEKLQVLIDSSLSYLIPFDFEFLRRGGRLSKTAYIIASTIKLIPIIKLSDDGKTLDKFSIQRATSRAFKIIINDLINRNINEDYLIIISHAFANEKDLYSIEKLIKETFPKNKVEIKLLSPIMITHGGPGCISIQTIKK